MARISEARITVSTVVEGFATGIIEVGAATPAVAPLCVALLKAKVAVDGAVRNREELEELCARCEIITVRVIDKARALKTSAIDVTPLRECVDELKEVAERYHRRRLTRLASFRRDGEDIERLRARVEAVPLVLGLADRVGIGEQLDAILVRKVMYSKTGGPFGQTAFAFDVR